MLFIGYCFALDGRVLDPVCCNPIATDDHNVSDELLRWHIRQPVTTREHEGSGGTNFFNDLQGRT